MRLRLGVKGGGKVQGLQENQMKKKSRQNEMKAGAL